MSWDSCLLLMLVTSQPEESLMFISGRGKCQRHGYMSIVSWALDKVPFAEVGMCLLFDILSSKQNLLVAVNDL